MGQLGAGDQVRIADQMVEHLGHDPPRPVVLVLLDEDAEERETLVAARKDVVRVQVAQLDEDPQQLGVEPGFGQRRHVVAEQPQALQRIHGMHRPLQRQVHVEALDQHLGLVDEGPAVRLGQRVLPGEDTEVGHGSDGAEPVTTVEPRFVLSDLRHIERIDAARSGVRVASHAPIIISPEPPACTAVIDSPTSTHEQASPNTGTRNIAEDAIAGPTERTDR